MATTPAVVLPATTSLLLPPSPTQCYRRQHQPLPPPPPIPTPQLSNSARGLQPPRPIHAMPCLPACLLPAPYYVVFAPPTSTSNHSTPSCIISQNLQQTHHPHHDRRKSNKQAGANQTPKLPIVSMTLHFHTTRPNLSPTAPENTGRFCILHIIWPITSVTTTYAETQSGVDYQGSYHHTNTLACSSSYHRLSTT